MSEKPAGLVEAIDCAANTMRDMGCTNRALAKVQEASLRKAKETTEQLVDSVLVLLRDYEAVHGDGDLEMQPALYQVRKSLEKAGATEMNNQAAQTMPELPEPTMRELNPYHGSRIDPYAGATHLQWYTAAQMHQYARDYAAALSQTAGVPVVRNNDDGTLDEVVGVGQFHLEQMGATHWWMQLGPHMVNLTSKAKIKASFGENEAVPAAPTASGVHPDALPDGTLSKSTAKRVTALAGASVSERALEPIECVCPAGSGCTTPCDRGWRRILSEARALPPSSRGNVLDFIEREMEQALTQQRGEPFAWAMTDHQADGPMTILTTNREDAKFWGEQGIDIEPLYKAPQPSADAVRELVRRWRELSVKSHRDGQYQGYDTLRLCADELESMLSAASGEGVDDTKRLDWIARQGGYEFDFGILNDQPGDGDWFVHGMGGSGQGATFRDAIDAAIKEEAGGQDANTDILDTLAFKTENGDAGRGSVTYIASVASGEADHQQNAAQGGGD